VIRQDLKHIGVDESEWYEAARKKTEWSMLYHGGMEREKTQSVQGPPVAGHVLCAICHRTFSCESDKKRHKCVEERRPRNKSLSEQCGAMQCPQCHK